jgi:hypothetical protein
MDRAAAQTSAETAANGEAIARLRVDMAALQAAINLQRDRLRTELYLGTAYFHRDMTGFREAVSMRLPKADGQFNGLRADMDQRFEALDTQLRDLRSDMDAKLDTILGELRKPID